MKGVLLPNPWASQQHEYLKHGGREPFASTKIMLGQVVPNFTGQLFSISEQVFQLQNIANFQMKIVSNFM